MWEANRRLSRWQFWTDTLPYAAGYCGAMSKEGDRELIRSLFARWNREGVAALEPFLDPACELTLPPELPGGGVRKGIEDTMAAFREWEGTSGVVNLEFELQELLDTEDGYFTVSLARGRGESGAPIPEHHWFHLLSLREGKLVRGQLFLDRDEAFRAAGLEE